MNNNYWTSWFFDWISTPQPWAYLLLWVIWIILGLWDMIRGLEIPCQKKSWEGVDRLVKGMIGFFSLHVIMLMGWEDGFEAFFAGAGISLLQVFIASPLILGILQNIGVIPKRDKPAEPAPYTDGETQKP